MSTFIRLAAGVLCLGLLALGVVAFDFTCPVTFPHPWDSAQSASIADAIERNERLNQEEEAIRGRREAKERVAQGVIARLQSLGEAIEEFGALDPEWPWSRSQPPPPLPVPRT